MTSIPAPPESIENGIGAGYDLQRTLGHRPVYGLVGVEWFQVIGEDQAEGGTAVASAGLGRLWGSRSLWVTEVRYNAFGQSLAMTRGRLDVTLGRRW